MEINNKQCADPARCTSTEEWINAEAMAMAGMLASPVDYHDDNIVKFALEYADAIIEAVEKGDNHA